MYLKKIAIIFIILSLFGGQAADASRYNIIEDSQSLNEHESQFHYNGFHKIKKDIAIASEKGIDWMLNQSNFKVGTLWVLGKLYQNTNDKRLEALYQKELSSARHKEGFKYYLKLFDDKLIVEELPKSEPVSKSDLFIIKNWLIAAVNCRDFALPKTF